MSYEGKEIVIPLSAKTVFDTYITSPPQERVTKAAIALYVQEYCTEFEQHIVHKLYKRGISDDIYKATISPINRAFEEIIWADDIFDDIYHNYIPDIFNYINDFLKRYTQPKVDTEWERIITWPLRTFRHVKCKVKLKMLCNTLYLSEYDCYKYAITDSASECYRQVIRGAVFASILLEPHKLSSGSDSEKASQIIEEFPLYAY